ncbi:MAG TPA: hypothetical protein VFV87_21845, partial [Pirellulaceae bacterium]|nr:hypothetical protein [Pirellulaceae bacterium]
WIFITTDGQLATERADGSLDLLQAFAVRSETLEGRNLLKWPKAKVETRTPTGRARMFLPLRPPGEYDVSAELTRLEGNGGAFIGLSIAGQPAILVIDGFPELGGRTGILPRSLSEISNAPLLRSAAPMLQTGSSTNLVVKVRLQDPTRYVVTVENGSRSEAFNGQIADLAAPTEFRIPMQYGMSFGSLDANIRFADFTLRPVRPGLPPELVAKMNGVNLPGSTSAITPSASIPSSQSSAGPNSVASPSPAPAAARKPLPAGDELTAKIEEARSIYQEEFKLATKPAQKAALARNIRTAGEGTRSDQTARYVLLDLARKVYIQAAEPANALALARQLEREFEIPPSDLAAATIEGLNDATLPSDERAALAKAAADMADELISTGNYERAESIAAIAVQSANRQKDTDLKKEILQRRAAVARIAKQYADVKSHLEKLVDQAADPVANLAAGRFHCMYLEDWARGLPQLSAAGDGVFSEPAKLDLDAGADSAKQLAAAEAWLNLAETSKAGDRDDKQAIQRRAKSLLQSAVRGLTGLDKVKAEKRLETLQDVGVGRKPPTASASSTAVQTASPASSAATAPVVAGELVGRARRDGADAGVVVTYRPGYVLTPEDVNRLTQAIGGGQMQIDLIGILTLTSDQELAILHSGGSSASGVNSLYIGNQKISEVGDDKSKEESKTVSLRRGTHLVRWSLTGGDFGASGLLITPATKPAAGAAPPFTFGADQGMQAAARRLPTRQTLSLGDGN